MKEGVREGVGLPELESVAVGVALRDFEGVRVDVGVLERVTVAARLRERVGSGVALRVLGGVAGGVALRVLGGVAGGVALRVLGGVAGNVALGVPVPVWLLLDVPVLDGDANGDGATVNDDVGETQTGSAAHAAEPQPHAALPQHAVSAQSVAPFMSLSMPSVQISAETATLQPPTM